MTLLPPGTTLSRTRDAAEARVLMSDRYKPHRMRRTGARRDFDFLHISTPVPGGSFNVLRYGGPVEISPEPFGDFYMLEMPVRGGVDLEPAAGSCVRSDERTALFIGPSLRFASGWREGCLQLMLKLDSRTVQRRWQQAVGSAVETLPEVPPAIDLATPEGWRVQQMMLLLRQELERTAMAGTGSLTGTPLAAAALDATFAYILAHHGVGTDRTRLLPAALRRCTAFIDGNLRGDLSVPVLLGVAGTSERTLFNLFRQFLDTTPKAYVRTKRLKACRALLLQGGISVSEAARRAGFVHMGRFASQYRLAFGEPPSATPAVRFLHPPSRD